uniref:BHLH domain-containing protein n=1 Tax=Trichogramma kaykai TaxID=54128 RepID=A0ABD2W502_9HYME
MRTITRASRTAASLRTVTGRAESTEGEKEKGYTYRAAGARRRCCSDRPSLLARLSLYTTNAPTSRRVCIVPCGRAPGRSALTHASTRLSSAYTPPGTSTCLCVHRAIGQIVGGSSTTWGDGKKMGVLLIADAVYTRRNNSDRNDMSNNNDNTGSVASAPSNNNSGGGGLQLLRRPWCFRERDWLTSPPPKKKWIRHYLLGEEPIDGQARQNGVYYHQPVHNVHPQQQHQLTVNVGGRNANINQPRIIVGSPISTVATVHGREIHSDVIQLQQQQPQAVQQQHQQSSSAQFNPHLENNNSNHSVSSVSGLAPAPVNEVDQQASTSQTSTGGEHRRTRNGSVSSSRSGTREVHNKLEKNRRAHLKECFETLKKQLPPSDDKKASNLAILHQSLRYIQVSLFYKKINYSSALATLIESINAHCTPRIGELGLLFIFCGFIGD